MNFSGMMTWVSWGLRLQTRLQTNLNLFLSFCAVMISSEKSNISF